MPPPTADFRHNPVSGSTPTTTTDTSTVTSNSGQQQLRRVQSRAVHGTIYYTPRTAQERRQPPAPTFPTPHIRARQRRPHTIHIVSYPPGYIPSELRSLLAPGYVKKTTAPPPLRRKRTVQDISSSSGQAIVKRRSNNSNSNLRHTASRQSTLAPSQQTSTRARVLEKLLAAFSAQPTRSKSPTSQQATETTDSTEAPIAIARTNSSTTSVRPNSFLSLNQQLPISRSHTQDSTQDHTQDNNTQDTQDSQDNSPALLAAAASSASSSEPPRETSPPCGTQNADLEEWRQRRLRAPVNLFSRIPDDSEPNGAQVQAMLAQQTMIAHQQHNGSHRNSFMSVRSVKNIMTSSVSEVMEKPIAAAGGMSFDIELAEPHLFLYGFDHHANRNEPRRGQSTPAILRGKLRLNVTKNVKIRAIAIKLQAKGRTEWPEGLPPLKVDNFEEVSIRTSNQTFFNAMHSAWSTPYGNNCRYKLKNESADSSLAAALSKFSHGGADSNPHLLTPGMSARDIKRLSLQQVQARSFGKDDSPNVQATQAKGYKVFYPGTYEFNFDFPIDHHQLETINLPYGSVKWWLEGCIERPGAFKPNLHGTKEVNIVRVPDQMSLETVEPISITRQWEDQLFYDIVISGKSFPIGGTIPIAFKLTPLAKVQLHKIKVIISESSEYWTTNRRVTRKDPGQKVVVFEKTAGRPVDPKYTGCDIRFTSGGELDGSQRAEARRTALRRREAEARRTGQPAEPLPDSSFNLLGDLDLGLESYWGSTELEMNVKLPTCKDMALDPKSRIHPASSWRQATVYHWIKVVLRISKLDPDDPTGTRRRHFEISIDSPFTILNCLATKDNTALPQYNRRDMSFADCCTGSTCGCPDATVDPNFSPAVTNTSSPTGSDAMSVASDMHLPMPPQAAHLHSGTHGMQPSMSSTRPSVSSSDNLSVDTPPTSIGASQTSLPLSHMSSTHTAQTDQEPYESPRPIHLMRIPSYAPPAFDADDSPPLAADFMTPPPNYDMIVGTPSVDGLADYFSRLANYDDDNQDGSNTANIRLDDDSDSDGDLPARITSRGGRVNVPHPRTPGGLHRAPSRSMDIQRPMVPFNLHMSNHAVRQAAE